MHLQNTVMSPTIAGQQFSISFRHKKQVPLQSFCAGYSLLVGTSTVFFKSGRIVRTPTCLEFYQSAVAIDIRLRLSRSFGIEQEGSITRMETFQV